MPDNNNSRRLTDKIKWRLYCCIIICFILILACCFQIVLFPNYHYDVMSQRILSWNLRELGNYPEHQIIYVIPISDGTRGYAVGYVKEYEVGVYPYLDDELEQEIRDLGYPFNFSGITYIGTDNYDDISKSVPPGGWTLYPDWVEKLIDPESDIKY